MAKKNRILKINQKEELPVIIDNKNTAIIGYFSLAYFLEEDEGQKI